MPNQLRADCVQPWIRQTRQSIRGREGERTVLFISVHPLQIQSTKEFCIPHTAPAPRAVFIQCDAHCRQWTRHSGHDATTGAEPSQASFPPLTAASPRKKPVSPPFLWLGSFPVRVSPSWPQPFWTDCAVFLSLFCLFFKKEVSSHVPLRLQVRQSHPVFH